MSRDQPATERAIVNLSRVFRHALESTQRETVPLAIEIEALRAYLEIERERFERRLQLRDRRPRRARRHPRAADAAAAAGRERVEAWARPQGRGGPDPDGCGPSWPVTSVSPWQMTAWDSSPDARRRMSGWQMCGRASRRAAGHGWCSRFLAKARRSRWTSHRMMGANRLLAELPAEERRRHPAGVGTRAFSKGKVDLRQWRRSPIYIPSLNGDGVLVAMTDDGDSLQVAVVGNDGLLGCRLCSSRTRRLIRPSCRCRRMPIGLRAITARAELTRNPRVSARRPAFRASANGADRRNRRVSIAFTWRHATALKMVAHLGPLHPLRQHRAHPGAHCAHVGIPTDSGVHGGHGPPGQAH